MGTTIEQLIDGLPIARIRGSASTIVDAIVEDSRQATPGCVFAARPGRSTDGRAFLEDAVTRGAVAVLTGTSSAPPIPDGVAVLTTPQVTAQVGPLAERLNGRPSEQLRLIGVTGTNGKTTVAHMVHRIARGSGTRCGHIGTIHVDDGRSSTPAALTTPPAPEISRHLAAMVRHGCTTAVIEVSSHALDQGRVAGLHFDIGVFTNLSGDHLDYHGTFDHYAQAKARLMRMLPAHGYAVVNVDDPEAPRMLDGCRARVLSCSLRSSDAACRAEIRRRSIRSTHVVFRGPWGAFATLLPLAGDHNVFNALQAAAVCHALGVDAAALESLLGRCEAPPGRLEPVTGPDHPFTVLVDYAHTDDALSSTLGTLRGLVPHGGRLRVVFGCGGDRDRTKRPRMGRVAAELADELIVTSDNPRTEDRTAIIEDIVAGIPADRAADLTIVTDRARAIEHAVEWARPGDVVLIAGKGHETDQIIGTTRRPFDDRRVAAATLQRLGAAATL